MKYLAILKDSFLEAIDTWVLYVMLALSALLIILVGSISFRPRPAATVMDDAVLGLNIDIEEQLQQLREVLSEGQQGGGGRIRFPMVPKRVSNVTYTAKGVEPIGDAPDGPNSPLLFTVAARFQNEEEAAAAKKNLAPVAELIKTRFASMGNRSFLDVTDVQLAREGNVFVKDPGPREVYLEISTKPNSATLVVWPTDMTLLFGAVPIDFPEKFPLGIFLMGIQEIFVNTIGATIAILVSIVLTAFFIPNMLRKGTIDLLLVKPIYRPMLLIYKYIGGLTFIILNTTFAVGGTWLVLSLRSGVWANSFLWAIPAICVTFAVIYAISTLAAVITRSAIVSILVGAVFWMLLYVVGQANLFFQQRAKVEEFTNVPREHRLSEGWWVPAIKTVYTVLPRSRDFVILTTQQMEKELLPQAEIIQRQVGTEPVRLEESLTSAGVFIALMLTLACIRFSLKDY